MPDILEALTLLAEPIRKAGYKAVISSDRFGNQILISQNNQSVFPYRIKEILDQQGFQNLYTIDLLENRTIVKPLIG